MTVSDWEKEFDELLKPLYEIGSGYFEHHSGVDNTKEIEAIKAFIAQLLEKQRAEFLRLVEVLPSPEFVIVSFSEEGKTKAGQLFVRKSDVLTLLTQKKEDNHAE